MRRFINAFDENATKTENETYFNSKQAKIQQCVQKSSLENYKMVQKSTNADGSVKDDLIPMYVCNKNIVSIRNDNPVFDESSNTILYERDNNVDNFEYQQQWEVS